MAPDVVKLLQIVAIFIIWQNEPCSAMHIDVVPRPVNELINDHVSITCLANDSPYWSRTIMVLSVGKKGHKPLATLSSGGEIQYGADRKSNMEAVGSIDKNNSTNSFIRLTIKQPVSGDAGMYNCNMYYLDGFGQLKEGQASTNMTMENDNDKRVILHLLKKVSDLEKAVEKESHTIDQQETKLNHDETLIASQDKQLKLQQDRTNKLETNGANVQKKVSDLKKTLTQQSIKLHADETELQHHGDQISDQGRQLQSQQDHSKAQDTNYANLLKKIADLQKSATQYNKKLQDQGNKLKNQGQLVASQGRQLKEQQDHIRQLHAKDGNDKTAFNSMTKKVSGLEKESTQQNNIIQNQKNKLNAFQEQLKTMNAKIDALGHLRRTPKKSGRSYPGAAWKEKYPGKVKFLNPFTATFGSNRTKLTPTLVDI